MGVNWSERGKMGQSKEKGSLDFLLRKSKASVLGCTFAAVLLFK